MIIAPTKKMKMVRIASSPLAIAPSAPDPRVT
jgi:hypothetical protein